MKLLIALAFGMVGSLVAISVATAETRFAVACIKNETRSNMIFNWRFGKDKPWQQTSLTPGEERIFSHKLPGVDQNVSPPLFVTYDAEAKGSYIEPKVLQVNFSAGNSNCNQAKKHVFRNDKTDSNFITLFVIN